MQQFLIGISGAVVGVVGWLLVGLFIQRRAHDRQARDAARAVYFELAANRLTIFVASRYDVYGQISSAAYERLLPEIATWMPPDELQTLVLAYLGHGGYRQAAVEDDDIPDQVRHVALSGLLDAHEVALELLHKRVFTDKEAATLNQYVSPDYLRLLDAAEESVAKGGAR